MALKDVVMGQFQLFNIEPSEEVVMKCLEMCSIYKVDPEELVDYWFAYTSSNLRGAAPTVEYLERMERKEFLKTKEQGGKINVIPVKEHSFPHTAKSYDSLPPNTDVLDISKENQAPISELQSPVHNRKLQNSILESTVSISGSSSDVYSKRTGSRSVQCSYGLKDAKFKNQSRVNISVKPVCEDNMKFNQTFMYEILGKRGRCINSMTEELLKSMKQKYSLDLDEDHGKEVEGENVYFGRIVSDSDGKINNQSVLLELTQTNKGQTLCLNLPKISKYSLFPGQVVAVKGSYEKTPDSYKDKIVVKEIYDDAIFNFVPEPPATNGNLQLLIASGPFTTQDSLSFEPLNDLLRYVKEYEPNVIILTGPFYERNHLGIMNGELVQTFDEFFFDIIDSIMKALENLDVHVVIVASQKEPHHFPIYPTPPYKIRQKYENLTFMSDPCMVDVNGLIIGATTADILFDISNFEIYLDRTNSSPPDRMGRLASHLLKQQSFYPLDPPNNDMCIDMSWMESSGIMAVKPHILVLPSNLRHFVKEIDNCLVINPERLTKGNGGGTFARMQINSGTTISITGRSACQILKI